MHLIQEIRDEAHRFAVAGRRGGRRAAGAGGFEAEELPGIGAARRKALVARLAAWPVSFRRRGPTGRSPESAGNERRDIRSPTLNNRCPQPAVLLSLAADRRHTIADCRLLPRAGLRATARCGGDHPVHCSGGYHWADGPWRAG